MGRDLLTDISLVLRHHGLYLLMQHGDLLLHQIDLRLLAIHNAIQFVDQVFGKTELGLEFGQSVFQTRLA